MTWFDITYGGQTYVENLTGTDEKTLVGLGFHGYATQAEAQAHPNGANYVQMLVASPILAGNVPVGVTNVPNPTTAAQGAGTAATAAWDAATAIPRFLSMLTSANLWIRVGEVVAGLILLGIGANALFKGKPMATVTNIAGKAAPLAMAG